MTVKTDADTIRVPAHVFDSIALTVCRASVILSRVNANEPTGPDQAEAMDDNACAAVHRVRQLLLYADGPDREKFAKDMGWRLLIPWSNFCLEHP